MCKRLARPLPSAGAGAAELTDRHQEQLAEIARRHREAQERELAAQAALQKQRRDRILRLARESRQAQVVRALVEIVRDQFGRDPFGQLPRPNPAAASVIAAAAAHVERPLDPRILPQGGQ